MRRILIDENFDQRILRGLKRQIERLDYVIVQETELAGSKIHRCLRGRRNSSGFW